MNAIELLQFQLELSKQMTISLLMNLHDEPLTMPTPDGGNHPLWIAGHLTYSEARLTSEILLGESNPLSDWRERFRGGSEPVSEASHYATSIPEIVNVWEEVRRNTLNKLAGLTEEDLEKPAANPPAGREAVFGTYGKVFTAAVMHPIMHRGQLADARRMLGRQPLMA